MLCYHTHTYSPCRVVRYHARLSSVGNYSHDAATRKSLTRERQDTAGDVRWLYLVSSLSIFNVAAHIYHHVDCTCRTLDVDLCILKCHCNMVCTRRLKHFMYYSTSTTRVKPILRLLWSPYVIGQTIIFSSCGFFFLLLLFFFPRLISAVAEWMSAILAHMVWP